MTAQNVWIDFWNGQKEFRDTAWQKNMQIFITETSKLLNYKQCDTVLDIGCGPGFLPTFLKGKVKEVYGVDTSERYVNLCKEKFKGVEGFQFSVLDKNNYTDLSLLGDKKFSLIISQSVIQYYRDIGEVEKLILEVKKHAEPGARFLISDIAIRNTMLPGIVSHLIEGLKDPRFLLETFRMFYRARMSNYHTILSDNGILVIPESEIYAMIKRLGLNAEVLSQRMTTNGGRRHLLIYL